MNWRLFGLGFVFATFVVCGTPSFAGKVSTDDASHTKSPLSEPNDSSIDRLKHRLADGQITDRILVIFKIIEFEPKLCRLNILELGSWGNGGDSRLTDRITHGLWEADDIRQLTNHPDVSSWSSPPLNLIAGREARYTLGGSIPVQRRTDDGVSHASDEAYGRSIIATATISNLNRIQLTVVSEVSDQTTSDGIAATGNKRCIDAAFEMNHGETRYFGRKVISTSGRETYQLIQATARLKPFEIPVDPEAIPISVIDDLSTPAKDLAEFNATWTAQSDIAARVEMMAEAADASQPVNLSVNDSVFARQKRRIDDNKFADEVLMSVVVSEVSRDDYEKRNRGYGYEFFRHRWPTFYWTFAADVFQIETVGGTFALGSSADLYHSMSSMRAFRPDRWTMQTGAKTWKMPAARAQSGKTIVWRSGGEAPIVSLDQYRRESIANERFGLTVTATPTVADFGEIQVHLEITLKDLVQNVRSLRVESARRMQATVRVRNGEIVSFGQPAVSDTGRESFLTFSLTACAVAPTRESDDRDDDTISALFPENSNAIRRTVPVNANFSTQFGIVRHEGSWAELIPPNFEAIENILETIELHQSLQPDAEVSQLSYRLAHPFDE